MSFKSFFKGAWDGTKSFFKGTGAVAKCLTSWNSSYRLFAGQNRFPMFTKSWWKTYGKSPSIKSWWNNLGCLQSILYCIAGFVSFVVIGGFLFLGSDILLDFEDILMIFESLGIFLEGLFNDIYDVAQIGLDWTFMFASFFFLSINPVYHFLAAACDSLGIGPLPMYILVGQASAILFLLIYGYFYKNYVSQAGIKYPLIAKIYGYLDFPFHFVVETFGKVFGNYARGFLDLVFFPLRCILIFTDILIDQIKF